MSFSFFEYRFRFMFLSAHYPTFHSMLFVNWVFFLNTASTALTPLRVMLFFFNRSHGLLETSPVIFCLLVSALLGIIPLWHWDHDNNIPATLLCQWYHSTNCAIYYQCNIDANDIPVATATTIPRSDTITQLSQRRYHISDINITPVLSEYQCYDVTRDPI